MIPDIAHLGFTSVADFQRAWNLGIALVPDNIPGPKTRAAAGRSADYKAEGKPDISKNFRVAEFKCHCGGKLAGCKNVLINRGVLAALEEQRRRLGGPLELLDGYRCPLHNKAVGGAKDSMHVFGLAVDPVTKFALATVEGLGVWSGIGYKPGQIVSHMDRRDLAGAKNVTRGSRDHPSVFHDPAL